MKPKTSIRIHRNIIGNPHCCVHADIPVNICDGILNEIFGIMFMIEANNKKRMLQKYSNGSDKIKWKYHATAVFKHMELMGAHGLTLQENLYNEILDFFPPVLPKGSVYSTRNVSGTFSFGVGQGIERAYDICTTKNVVWISGAVREENIINPPAYLKDLPCFPWDFHSLESSFYIGFPDLERLAADIYDSVKQGRKYIWRDEATGYGYRLQERQKEEMVSKWAVSNMLK